MPLPDKGTRRRECERVVSALPVQYRRMISRCGVESQRKGMSGSVHEEAEMRRVVFAVVTVLLVASVVPAVAQDAVKADPSITRSSSRTTGPVLRITYGPYEKSVMHEHPANVAIFLTDGRVDSDADGKTVMRRSAGGRPGGDLGKSTSLRTWRQAVRAGPGRVEAPPAPAKRAADFTSCWAAGLGPVCPRPALGAARLSDVERLRLVRLRTCRSR
jgi:hypothetical protein